MSTTSLWRSYKTVMEAQAFRFLEGVERPEQIKQYAKNGTFYLEDHSDYPPQIEHGEWAVITEWGECYVLSNEEFRRDFWCTETETDASLETGPTGAQDRQAAV